MGIYADRFGRRVALTRSILIVAFGSLLIALCPTYATIGVAAPAVLVLARVLQGLSLGGEYGTSATYLSEIAEEKHRGFYSSFHSVGQVGGQLLSLGIIVLLQGFLLSEGEMEAWGWRIPFAVAALTALVALYVRSNIDETGSFQANAHRPERGRLRELLRYPREMLLVAGLTVGGTICFYTYTTYMQKFMVNTTGFPRDTATQISMLATLVYLCALPAVGALSDRIGRRLVLILFGLGATVTTVPIMTALSHAHTAVAALLLNLTALLIVTGYFSINAVVKAELFPAHIRALGVALPFSVTVSLFGGTAEYVALWLKNAGHETWFFWYVSACALVSLVTYVFMRDTKKHSQIVD